MVETGTGTPIGKDSPEVPTAQAPYNLADLLPQGGAAPSAPAPQEEAAREELGVPDEGAVPGENAPCDTNAGEEEEEEEGGCSSTKKPSSKPHRAAPVPGITLEEIGPGRILVPQPEALEAVPYKAEVITRITSTVPGFVSDFAQSFLNTESPDLFNVWAGLFAVSVLGARQARFKWAVGEMIPNLYVVLVADPSKCHKGAAMGRAGRLLQALPGKLLADGASWLSQEKDIEMISSKATPDGLLLPMRPHKALFLLPGGQVHTENFGSRAFVWSEEFATFLNARKYNTGLVDTLTYYYDCPLKDKQFTQARGREEYERVFLCIAGAMTPAHLQRSMPEEIYSGGFMSRVVLVHVDSPERIVALPDPAKTPIKEGELLERLEYLAWTARGEYYFNKEAEDWYVQWYTDYKTRLIEKEAGITDFSQARFEHLLLRIATLFRMSEYREGNDITLADILAAKDLLEYTLKKDNSIQYAMVPTKTDELQHLAFVRSFLKRRGEIERGALIRKCSKSAITANEVNAILHQLHEEGRIEYIFQGSVSKRSEPSVDQSEIYRWVHITSEGDDE